MPQRSLVVSGLGCSTAGVRVFSGGACSKAGVHRFKHQSTRERARTCQCTFSVMATEDSAKSINEHHTVLTSTCSSPRTAALTPGCRCSRSSTLPLVYISSGLQQEPLNSTARYNSPLFHAQARLPRARAPRSRQRRRARSPGLRLRRVRRPPRRRARPALRSVRLRPLALPPCSGHAKSATKSEPSKRVCAGDATAVSTCACNLGLKPAPAASLCSSALQRACQISEKKIPEKTSRLAPTRRDAPEGAGRL